MFEKHFRTFVFLALLISLCALYYFYDLDISNREYSSMTTRNDTLKYKITSPSVRNGIKSSHRSPTSTNVPPIAAVVDSQEFQKQQAYYAMKYGQHPHHQRLMNMSLTIAESGALALRVAAGARESLDYKALRLNELTQELGAAKDNLNSSGRNASSLKHILYWNKFSQFDNFNFGAGEEAFVLHGCQVSACTATEVRSQVVPEDEVDAILYCLSINERSKNPVPPLPRESPERQARSLEMYGRSFDYTISYRYDSDARTGYGRVYAVDAPADNSSVKINYADGKTKMAAWFVSNCYSAPSKRMSLTKQLQRHGVAVDIYGSCGSLKCPKKDKNDCYNMLEKKYKFYFSFENSLCNHYVTEKFNNILKYNIVPVTYGLGHELSGAPKDAYIDVFDFPDVKSLAQYLLYLNSNDTAYNEYFRWKQHYKVTSGFYHPFCKLCADLHADPPLPARKYDLQAWFSEGQCIDGRKNPRLKAFLGL